MAFRTAHKKAPIKKKRKKNRKTLLFKSIFHNRHTDSHTISFSFLFGKFSCSCHTGRSRNSRRRQQKLKEQRKKGKKKHLASDPERIARIPQWKLQHREPLDTKTSAMLLLLLLLLHRSHTNQC
jgi:hypothetical protein